MPPGARNKRKMKIALIGYGKMGHIIEEEARRRGHEIVCIIDLNEESKFSSAEFASADAAIEFTVPGAAVGNIKACVGAGVPVVCGTTGWLGQLPEVSAMCLAEGGRLIHATNFSIGVNIFQAVNRYLSGIMSTFGQYVPELEETHHIHKLDHPSGTAITTAEQTVASCSRLSGWEESDTPAAGVLPVKCHREGEVPGIHTIKWESADDCITLSHSAKSRRGFALGAVMAAEWIAARPVGVYSVSDMLAEITNTNNIFK